MLRVIILFVLILFSTLSFAQPGKKPVVKEKPPTQKEMEDMMKEAQKAMDEMSPEDKKMMDSLGIKMPSMKNIPKVSDKQLADAWEEETRIVPIKDNARIAAISKTALTASALTAYLESVYDQLTNKLEPEVVQTSEKIYNWLKAKDPDATATGNAGAGLWMMGFPKHALYILSKACLGGAADADILNNFAACLTMAGAEQLALPVLTYLNKQYPQNSTILNNIGQAWFGLGDMDKATKYLDSTLTLCPWHAQANLTKSRVEESKGNTGEAIALVKRSIQKNYSREKEDRLRKLGYKLKGNDLDWMFPRKPDPLGLEEFRRPDFPTSVMESITLKPFWEDFREKCINEVKVLETQLKQAEATMQQKEQRRREEIMSLVKNSIDQGSSAGNLPALPLYIAKASLKLQELSEGKDGYAFKLQKSGASIAEYLVSSAPLETAYEKEIEELTEKELEQTGEGKPSLSFCPQKRDAADKYLSAYNMRLQALSDDYLKLTRNRLNEEAYWSQFMQWPDQFEVTKLNLKIGWMNLLRDALFKSITEYKCAPPKPPRNTGKLTNFNDIHCQYHSELNLGFGSMENDCDKMTTKIDISVKGFGLKGKLKQDFGDNKNSFSDQFVGCTIELGYKEGVGFGKGPLRAEAKAGAYGFVEIDRTGFTDGGIKLTADIKAGTNIIKSQDGTESYIDKNGDPIPNLSQGPIKDVSLTVIGAEAKISIMSGFSVEGKGILKGIKK